MKFGFDWKRGSEIFEIVDDGAWVYYTEQKKKRNNYISLNFEQTLIQLEIIAFSTSAFNRYQASECKKPIFILMHIYGVIQCRPWAC